METEQFGVFHSHERFQDLLPVFYIERQKFLFGIFRELEYDHLNAQ